MLIRTAFAGALLCAVCACFVTSAEAETCVASQYGVGDGYHGRRTASGERFNTYALTAAHRTWPFGTIVHVTNLENRKVVLVTINDRGPFVRGRCIDLSRAAANAIGMGGTAKVFVAPGRVIKAK